MEKSKGKKKRKLQVLKTFVYQGVGFNKGMLAKEGNFLPGDLGDLIKEGFLREYDGNRG